MRPIAAILAGSALYAAAGSLVPFGASHELTEQCAWVSKRHMAVLRLDRGKPTAQDAALRTSCLNRRGGYGFDVQTIIERWPDRAQLTALRSAT